MSGIDEPVVRADIDVGSERAENVDRSLVRGRRQTIEQSGIREDQGAGADRCHERGGRGELSDSPRPVQFLSIVEERDGDAQGHNTISFTPFLLMVVDDAHVGVIGVSCRTSESRCRPMWSRTVARRPRMECVRMSTPCGES